LKGLSKNPFIDPPPIPLPLREGVKGLTIPLPLREGVRGRGI